jgi:hydrogenase maturation protease
MTPAPETSPPVLILGLGNDILSDDAIGLRVLDEMERTFPGAFDFRKCNLGGLDILELIREYARVVMIDAIKTEHGRAGTVSFLTTEDFNKTLHISNFHDIDILSALEIGRKLGMEMPERIDIIAVKILEDTEFSEKLSPALEAAFPMICSETEQWIRLNLLKK